jgi:hypothetical protein
VNSGRQVAAPFGCFGGQKANQINKRRLKQMTPIFESKRLGCKVILREDMLEYKEVFKTHFFPVNRIAKVETGGPTHDWVIIETTGGEKKRIIVPPGKKEELARAIVGLINTN